MNYSILTTTSLLFLFTIILAACGTPPASPATSPVPRDSIGQSTSPAEPKQIVFFGNSITAGYGLQPSETFTTLIQQRLDSLKLAYRAVNAGLSGETSSGGLSRISWVLRQPVSIFVLELGGNDGLRGIPLSLTEKNLQAIIDSVHAKYPTSKIILAGMEIPPNLGIQYTKDFHALFPKLANSNNAALIPFLLQGVGGVDSLNQGDGIHPNAAGERIVAENAWKVLEKLL